DRSQHHPRGAGVEHRLDRRGVAQPAAHLNGDADRAADGGDQRRLYRPPGTRAIEVHDVDPPCPQRLPATGKDHGVVAVDGLAREIALGKTHAAAAAQVDCGIDDHRAMVRTNPRSRLKPTRWLFSGWKTPA